MTELHISVVIPCYNRSSLLRRAVDSVLAQTVRPAEIIVVDDGSTDDSKAVCASYGDQIRYIWQKNAGASAARNTGVEGASHPWVAFLDSDDYWTPSHIEKMAAAIQKTGGAANFYFCDMRMGETKDATTLWQMIQFTPPSDVYLTHDGTNWAFLRRQPTMLQCAVFRKDAWNRCQGLDTRLRLVHDTDIFLQLSVDAKVCAVNQVGCVQTDDDVSAVRLTTSINNRTVAFWEESTGMWEKVRQQFPKLRNPYHDIASLNVAICYWRRLRMNWAMGRRAQALALLPKILSARPGFFIAMVLHRKSDATAPSVTPEFSAS